MKVRAGEDQPVPSVTAVWPAANWLEREVCDMFGVNFTGHPDRRRILMPDDWQGFPQRKDYPLEGPGELLMENPMDWLKLRQAQRRGGHRVAWATQLDEPLTSPPSTARCSTPTSW